MGSTWTLRRFDPLPLGSGGCGGTGSFDVGELLVCERPVDGFSWSPPGWALQADTMQKLVVVEDVLLKKLLPAGPTARLRVPLSVGLLREGASAGFTQGVHPDYFQRDVISEAPKNPSFRRKKLIFRELDRPLKTAPKTTRESTSTKSRRACTPSRVTRLKKLIRLSSSRRLMCLFLKNRYEHIVAQFNFKA